MSIYIIAQLKFIDRPAYQRYQGRFFDVFRKFSGKVLIADEEPEPLEGNWDRDKIVVLEFPNEVEARRFLGSAEYEEIARDRKVGADGLVILAKGFSMPRGSA